MGTAVLEAAHICVVFQKLSLRGRRKRNWNRGKQKEKENPQEGKSQERSRRSSREVNKSR